MVYVVLILVNMSVMLSQAPWLRMVTAVKKQAIAPKATASEVPAGHIMKSKMNIILKRHSFTFSGLQESSCFAAQQPVVTYEIFENVYKLFQRLKKNAETH